MCYYYKQKSIKVNKTFPVYIFRVQYTTVHSLSEVNKGKLFGACPPQYSEDVVIKAKLSFTNLYIAYNKDKHRKHTYYFPSL